MKRFCYLFAFSLALLCGFAAKAATLVAPQPVNNGNAGVMFDVHALSTITVNGLSVMLRVGSARTMNLYGRSGSHVGFESSPAAWTLLGSVAVPALLADTDTALAIPLAVVIPANATYAFFVTTPDGYNGSSVRYRDTLTAVGTVLVADAALEILVGTGKNEPFAAGAIYRPRAFVGSLSYVLATPDPTVVPTLSEYGLYLLGLIVMAFGLRAGRRRW